MIENIGYNISPSYIQNEQWFEVSRGEGYILLVNSYGRLRKVFTAGGYKDLHNGGEADHGDS